MLRFKKAHLVPHAIVKKVELNWSGWKVREFSQKWRGATAAIPVIKIHPEEAYLQMEIEAVSHHGDIENITFQTWFWSSIYTVLWQTAMD